jgi:hypothetical protein
MGNCFCGAESQERMESYKNLTVYQKSCAMVLRIYQTSKNFPKEEIIRTYISIEEGRGFHPLQHRRGVSPRT